MADVSRLLDMLHPMREPPMPAAITPFLLMAALGGGAALLFALCWRFSRGRSDLRRAAEAALGASRALAPPERLAAQARLLRRLVRGIVGETETRKQGPAWLASLDRAFATQFFTQGEGQAYGDALYSPRAAPDVEALDGSLGRLIAKVRTKKVRA